MNNWGANHCVMSCGHIGADLISLASLLRIPVYMHNVAEDKVFRPSAWAAFGTDDLTGRTSAPVPTSARSTARGGKPLRFTNEH